MKSSSALTAAKTVIRWLRWAVVLALVYSALGGQELMGMLRFYVLPGTAVVVAGAMIAPRARRTTAIVLAALHVLLSLRGHVLATGGPWWFWTINYTHFTLEALGSVLGVAYIFWSEKAKGSVAGVQPGPPPP